MKIDILNPVYSQVDRQHLPLVEKVLSYPDYVFRQVYDAKQKRFRSQRQKYPASFVSKAGVFPTGFVPRVLEEVQISSTVIDHLEDLPNFTQVIPPTDITLREDQQRIVSQCLEYRRGLIESPTGSGKTVLAAALIHSIRVPTIFLCHTTTLVKNAHREFTRMGLHPTIYAGTIGKEISDLTVATIQSFKKAETYFSHFDMVIMDEAHHLSSPDTDYWKTLGLLPAPWRYGFTATVPSDLKHYLTMEGMFGPIIGSLSLQEGIDRGILAQIKIKILKTPMDYDIKDLRKYQEVYEAGVIRRYARNRLIMEQVQQLAREGKTTLILVNKIAHGEILQRISRRFDLRSTFIQGKDGVEFREDLREDLQQKKIDCVIATTIWKEGVNIPSLDCIINAGGGKSEIATLQAIGRGLRTTEEKKEVLLIDIFDPCHHYLIYHFAERFSIYSENNWI